MKSKFCSARTMLGESEHLPSEVALHDLLLRGECGERARILQVQSDFMAAYVQHIDDRSGRKRATPKEHMRTCALCVKPSQHCVQLGQESEACNLRKVET